MIKSPAAVATAFTVPVWLAAGGAASPDGALPGACATVAGGVGRHDRTGHGGDRPGLRLGHAGQLRRPVGELAVAALGGRDARQSGLGRRRDPATSTTRCGPAGRSAKCCAVVCLIALWILAVRRATRVSRAGVGSPGGPRAARRGVGGRRCCSVPRCSPGITCGRSRWRAWWRGAESARRAGRGCGDVHGDDHALGPRLGKRCTRRPRHRRLAGPGCGSAEASLSFPLSTDSLCTDDLPTDERNSPCGPATTR